METLSADTRALVDEWLRLDKNERTRGEIEVLASVGDDGSLTKRLATRIEFGTAGLRGRMEAGFSRMNDLTVIQASQGLSTYVLNKIPNAKEKGVVIGHDHRHNSDRWALLTARAFIAKGIKAYLHRGLVHTPLVPFSVGRLKAACGVMITASHNPKNDNGYKVYWENAVQIIEPHDKGIAEAILENLESGPEAWDVDGISDSPLCIDKTEEMEERYFEHLLLRNQTRALNAESQVRFVSTAMHGVGHRFGARAVESFGFKPFSPVQAQMEPDPEFPTVPYPNPEEKGALDLALEEAKKQDAQYVVALDPDADRFAVAEKLPDGTWKQFSGDQIGTLFAAWVFEGHKKSGKAINKLAMVASTVSSKMVQSMARVEGFRFAECLTGFKYIGNTALKLQAEGYDVPFGYEEAIGFMFGDEIRDKDGVAAMVTFAEMAVSLRAEGKTVSQRLEELYEKYGFHETRNSYFRCLDPVVKENIFAGLRSWTSPAHRAPTTLAFYPCVIGDFLPIRSIRDLTAGWEYDSTGDEQTKWLPDMPTTSGNMITFVLGGKKTTDYPRGWGFGSVPKEGVEVQDFEYEFVMTLRSSGTEPKIKYYIEGRGPERNVVDKYLSDIVVELRKTWMRAQENGLTEPTPD